MKLLLILFILSNFAYADLSCSEYLDQDLVSKVNRHNCLDISNENGFDLYIALVNATRDEPLQERAIRVFERLYLEHAKDFKLDICEEITYLSLSLEEQKEFKKTHKRFDYPDRTLDSKNQICQGLEELLISIN